MNIEQLTIKEAREISSLFNQCNKVDSHPWAVGEKYFIRTVTHHFTGELVSVYHQELVLKNAAWIASDGRFKQAIETGVFDEVEPFPADAHVIVGRGSVIDSVRLTSSLPRDQK